MTGKFDPYLNPDPIKILLNLSPSYGTEVTNYSVNVNQQKGFFRPIFVTKQKGSLLKLPQSSISYVF